jgi:hypothetical protein
MANNYSYLFVYNNYIHNSLQDFPLSNLSMFDYNDYHRYWTGVYPYWAFLFYVNELFVLYSLQEP